MAATKMNVPASYNNTITIVLCAGILSNAMDVHFSGLRYLTYLVPFIVFFIWAMYGTQLRVPFRRRYFISATMIALAPVISLLSGNKADPVPFIALTAAPMFAGSFVWGTTRKNIYWLLITLCLSVAIVAGSNGFGTQFIDFVSSSGIAESQMSFPLVLTTVALFAMGGRRRVSSWASALAMLVSFKRISVLAALVVIAAQSLFSRKWLATALDRSAGWRVMVAWLTFVILGTLSVEISSIAVFVQRQFPDLFSSPESLLLGRYEFTRVAHTLMEGRRPDLTPWIGFGAGSVRSMLGDQYFPRIHNFLLHNDYLFVRFEFGYLGFILIFGAFAYVLAGSRYSLLLAVAQAVLFMTDNTLIYSFHIYALLLCESYLVGRAAAIELHRKPIVILPSRDAGSGDFDLMRGPRDAKRWPATVDTAGPNIEGWDRSNLVPGREP